MGCFFGRWGVLGRWSGGEGGEREEWWWEVVVEGGRLFFVGGNCIFMMYVSGLRAHARSSQLMCALERVFLIL